MAHLTHRAALASVILATITIGCSKDELDKLAAKAKNAVAEGGAKAKEAVSENVEAAKKGISGAAAEVQEQAGVAGRITLDAGGEVKTGACYASFITQASGRDAVLQLRSYRDAENESFPSVFLQAQVRAGSAAELTNTSIEARLFVQVEQNGRLLSSEAGKPVELKVVSVEGKVLKAELAAASLVDPTTGESVTTTGQFEGVLQ